MKHPIEDSARARQFRFDATLDGWVSYQRGYRDALDDADDAAERERRGRPVEHIDGQAELPVD
jgi:hypothetical protein